VNKQNVLNQKTHRTRCGVNVFARFMHFEMFAVS